MHNLAHKRFSRIGLANACFRILSDPAGAVVTTLTYKTDHLQRKQKSASLRSAFNASECKASQPFPQQQRKRGWGGHRPARAHHAWHRGAWGPSPLGPPASPLPHMKWGCITQPVKAIHISFPYSSWEASAAVSSVFIILTAGVEEEEEKSKG